MHTQEQQRWRQHALCYKTDTNLFFPSLGDNNRQVMAAKKICLGCPVIADCRAYALSYDSSKLPGIYGGLTQYERKRIQRGK